MAAPIKCKLGIASVAIKLHSGTEFVYYPSRGQVQMLVIAQDGFMFKEATVDVEKFMELMGKIAEEKSKNAEI